MVIRPVKNGWKGQPSSSQEENHNSSSTTTTTKTTTLVASVLLHNKTINLATRKGGLDLQLVVSDLQASPMTAFAITGQLLLDGNQLKSIPEDLFPLLPNVWEKFPWRTMP
jgi:hypothetical protein